MPRKKGLPKTGGRKSGSRNKTDSEIRQALINILDKNLPRLETAIDGMKDEDAAKLIVQLARHYTYPALNPEKLTEDQLLQIIQYIKQHETNT